MPRPKLRTRQQTALALAREIAQIEAQIAPLQTRLSELNRQFAALVPNDVANGDSTDVTDSVTVEVESDGPIPDRIERFLVSYGRPADADTIAKGIGMFEKKHMPTVRNSIGRLVNATPPRIWWVSRGLYAALPKGQNATAAE